MLGLICILGKVSSIGIIKIIKTDQNYYSSEESSEESSEALSTTNSFHLNWINVALKIHLAK